MVGYPYVCILVIPDFKPGDMPPTGYLEKQEWARVQMRAGKRQTQCRKCKRWYFPQEWPTHTCKGRQEDAVRKA